MSRARNEVLAVTRTAPIFAIAGLMHPLSMILVYRLLPDKYFENS